MQCKPQESQMQSEGNAGYLPICQRVISSKAHAALAGVVLIGAIGCNELAIAPPSEVPGQARRIMAATNASRANAKSSDQVLYEQTSDLPSFAGVALRRDGLHIFLTRTSEATEAALVALIRQRIERVSAEHAIWARRPVTIELARHSFAELYLAYGKLASVEGPPEITYTYIDPKRSSIVLATESEEAKATAADWARLAGIPDAYVTTVVAPRATLTSNVIYKLRPSPAGMLIHEYSSASADSVALNCTLGFNVRIPNSAHEYFLTASHCSYRLYSSEDASMYYWQLDSATATLSRIGVEVSDPSTFTGGSCPSGKVCRWSDVSLNQYDDSVSVDFAKIAMGLTNLSFATTNGWAGMYSPMAIQAAATGFSTGNYVPLNGCVNVYPASGHGRTQPANMVFLCQAESDIQAQEGDSGGAVLQSDYYDLYGKLQPLGIVWGKVGFGTTGNALYSPVGNIANDLGTIYYY